MEKRRYRILEITALFLSLVFSLLMLRTNGWFAGGGEKAADTTGIEVDMPPILYILDNDAEDMTQLSLSGLEIGQPKDIVFCVSSIFPVRADADASSKNKLGFDLELAYTSNLGASFDLYAANITDGTTGDAYYSQKEKLGYFEKLKSLDAWTAGDPDSVGNAMAYDDDYATVGIENTVTYKIYPTSSRSVDANSSLRFQTNVVTPTNPLFNTLMCRFFILHIDWPDTSSAIDAKETDLVYIVARGAQTEE